MKMIDQQAGLEARGGHLFRVAPKVLGGDDVFATDHVGFQGHQTRQRQAQDAPPDATRRDPTSHRSILLILRPSLYYGANPRPSATGYQGLAAACKPAEAGAEDQQARLRRSRIPGLGNDGYSRPLDLRNPTSSRMRRTFGCTIRRRSTA